MQAMKRFLCMFYADGKIVPWWTYASNAMSLIEIYNRTLTAWFISKLFVGFAAFLASYSKNNMALI